MKTTFKKVFDEFDDEMMNIDINSVCGDIDIDVERIKGEVFMRLGNEEKKKRISKKVIVMLVAAAIIAFGAIGVYASGSLQYAFQGWFSGNLNSSGLYDGGKVELKNCDDSLDVNLLGVTGDDEKIYASIEVTKKDGSAVIDEGYEQPFWSLKDADEIPEADYNMLDYFRCRVDYTDKNGATYAEKSGDTLAKGATHIVKYQLSEDNKTLRLYVYVLRSNGELKDGRMTVTSESVGARKLYELLDKCAMEEEFDDVKIEKRQEELNISAEDCIQINTDGFKEYYYADTKNFDLPFEISFDLNYRNDSFIEKKLSSDDAPDFVESIAGDTKMTITPFGIYMFGQCDVNADETEVDMEEHNMEYHCFKDVGWDDTSKIVLNDGTVYYLYPYEGGYKNTVDSEDKSYYDEKFTLNYSTVVGAPFEPEYNVIDTREIDTVFINGNLVYSK